MTRMRFARRRFLVIATMVLAGTGVLVFAGSRAGLFGLAEKAYAEWSLRSRVRGLCDARMKGDLERIRGFVVGSAERQSAVGNAVRYLGFDIKSIEIKNDVANVHLDASYEIALPGFSSKDSPVSHTWMPQKWLRVGRTWYWDPGPRPTAGIGLRSAPDPTSGGTGPSSQSTGEEGGED